MRWLLLDRPVAACSIRKAQLADFNGTLQTDGYAAYSKAVSQLNQQEQQITHASCWAHTRRAFEKALKMVPEAAQQALGQVAVLYQHEKHIRDEQLDLSQSRNTASSTVSQW
ncbi:IS66 family transposase [Pseudoalteromonas sp. ASV78]|uniref:IS66 family transposase n=1 Tax=Pseudoalteromonas sp. ASV78 TaxID=3397851 RepID=UPI0039FC6008